MLGANPEFTPVTTPPVETSGLEGSAKQTWQPGETLEQTLPTIPGFSDKFLERRFQNAGQIDLEQHAKNGLIAFLSKSNSSDEFYRIENAATGLSPGLYRIRDEGTDVPVVTVKHQGDGHGIFSQTIDCISPDEEMLDAIRSNGEFVGVVEKTRVTYKANRHPGCLIHEDEVLGLGKFYDVKADTIEALEGFITGLGLSNSSEIKRSYFEQKQEAGVSKFQLKVWKFHKEFEDYIIGVVSGTLTPLGFLSATVASGGSKSAMIVALLSAGLCDGLSDSVAASQSTQSGSRASPMDQAKMFAKTLLGKVAVPLTFVPMVMGAETNSAITYMSCTWAAALLSATAAVQAIAHERSLPASVGRILGWGSAAVGIGTALGNFIPPLLENLLK